jgi:hypothetical protein
MVPGEYSVCRVVVPDTGSDQINFEALKFGYDSVEQAYRAFAKLSEEFELTVSDLAVVRVWFHHDLAADPESGR